MDDLLPMSSGKKGREGQGSHTNLLRAFDEAQFGPARTLNLCESLPTVEAARIRSESWLRERQMQGEREVLIITGRGNSSYGGRSPVREGIVNSFPMLRRKGVVSEWREHSPGSFEVVLAPISALFDAPRRKGDSRGKENTAPARPLLEGLDPATTERLRYLAMRSLETLGIDQVASLVEAEMVSRFSLLAGKTVGTSRDIKQAIEIAIEELDR